MVAAIGGLVVSTHAQESGQMAMDAAVSRVRLACCGSAEDNGCLAFIFLFIFVQRLHQIATMEEIAEKIKENLVNAEELKQLLSQICGERYPDTNQFMTARHALEMNFPLYAELT